VFSGTATALITPFRRDGSIDEEALRRLVDFQESNGVDVLVPCGSTGESATLNYDEHIEVIRIVMDQAKKAKVVAGTGSNSTSEAIALSRHAQDVGADGVLSISPYYNKPTQEGIYRHYKAISEAIDIPMILYNVPGRTGSNMSPETTLRLAELPGIAAIKEACGSIDQIQNIVSSRPKGFLVLSGDDSLTFPMMALGCDGTVSVASNCFPKEISEMVRLCLAGKYAEARSIHMRMLPFFSALFIESNPIPIKYIMKNNGFGTGAVRLPLTELTPASADAVDAILKRMRGIK
jgi:4-hydroxy-tetrahydrodipicolinate synthase